MKLGVGRRARDAEWQCTRSGDRGGCIGRWQKWEKESEWQQRCCGADEEGDTTSRCGPRRKKTQRQWRRQTKKTGQSRKATQNPQWRRSWQKKVRRRGGGGRERTEEHM